MSNWFTNLGSELSTALGAAGSALTPTQLTKALKGVFASKYATVIAELQALKGLGPMGPSAQLNASITIIEQQLVPLTPAAGRVRLSLRDLGSDRKARRGERAAVGFPGRVGDQRPSERDVIR